MAQSLLSRKHSDVESVISVGSNYYGSGASDDANSNHGFDSDFPEISLKRHCASHYQALRSWINLVPVKQIQIAGGGFGLTVAARLKPSPDSSAAGPVKPEVEAEIDQCLDSRRQTTLDLLHSHIEEAKRIKFRKRAESRSSLIALQQQAQLNKPLENSQIVK